MAPSRKPFRTDYHDSGKISVTQAIVLAAGCGSRLSSINFGTSKCLLPVANIPMLYYPLHKLQTTGFTNCEIVIPQGLERQVREMISKYRLTIKPNFHPINLDDGLGTLDSVRKAAPSIRESTRRVIIMSSDLITNVDIKRMCDYLICNGAAMAMLISHYDENLMRKPPGAKEAKLEDDSCDSIHFIYDTPIMYKSLIGGDEAEESSQIAPHEPSGTIVSTTSVPDQHLYVFDKNVLTGYILSKSSACKKMTSLKTEAVPHLIDMQFLPIKSCKPGYLKAATRMEKIYTELLNPIDSDNRLSPVSKYVRTVVYCEERDEIVLRANNRTSYWHLNGKIPAVLGSEKIAKGCTFVVGAKQKGVSIGEKASIEGQTLLGEDVTVGGASVVRDSNVGARVCLGSGCRVTNCVLMPGITIADGCQLEDSFISCDIKAKEVEVVKCIVACSTTFSQGERYDGETFESFLEE